MRDLLLKAIGVLFYLLLLGISVLTFPFTPWRLRCVGYFMDYPHPRPVLAFVYAMEWSFWSRMDSPNQTPRRAARQLLKQYTRGELP